MGKSQKHNVKGQKKTSCRRKHKVGFQFILFVPMHNNRYVPMEYRITSFVGINSNLECCLSLGNEVGMRSRQNRQGLYL